MATPADLAVIGLLAARPDGSTSLACGIGACLAAAHRVLLVDLCFERPEIAVLLDIDDEPGIDQLIHQLKLAPITGGELEARVLWHDGLGVLAGSGAPLTGGPPAPEVANSLLSATHARFDNVVVDVGRPRPTLPDSLMRGALLWVVVPSPLGMAALDAAVNDLARSGWAWQASARAVLNRVSDSSWRGVAPLIEREYGMEVVGAVPETPRFWRTLEFSHSLRALHVPIPDRTRFERAYGAETLALREALSAVIERLASTLAPEA